MNNQEAIKILKMHRYEMGLPNQGSTWKANADTIACDLAITALEAQQSDRWIPISERLPEDTGHYLVTVVYKKDKQTQVESVFFAGAELDENPEWRDPFSRYRDIKAWKLMPEPWKEEQ